MSIIYITHNMSIIVQYISICIFSRGNDIYQFHTAWKINYDDKIPRKYTDDVNEHGRLSNSYLDTN